MRLPWPRRADPARPAEPDRRGVGDEGRLITQVVFLKGRKLQWASAYLRADQLCELIAPALAERGVPCSVRTDIAGVSQGLVVLNKTFLPNRIDLLIAVLKARKNIVACDFVDRRPDERVCNLVDVLISSSHLQDQAFRSAYPHKRVVHVPHHADLRITGRVEPLAPVRVGYFGEPANALHLEALVAEGLCEAVAVDSVTDAGWLARLADYRCHYAVRAWQAWNGFKPFTKGAVAAEVGAVVLTDRNGETVHALGEDYPFFTPSTDYADVRATVQAVMRQASERDWATAQRAMARVRAARSPEVIRAAFDEMLGLSVRELRAGGLRRLLRASR